MQTLNITDLDFIDYDLLNASFSEAWFEIDNECTYYLEYEEWTKRDLDGEVIRPLTKPEIKTIEVYAADLFFSRFENEIEGEELEMIRKDEHRNFMADYYEN